MNTLKEKFSKNGRIRPTKQVIDFLKTQGYLCKLGLKFQILWQQICKLVDFIGRDNLQDFFKPLIRTDLILFTGTEK
jgi:hypothetical protein